MMKGGLAGLMKQAQAMQDNMKKAQEQLALIEVEGQSGAGMVKVVMTCSHDVRRVSIDPSVLDDREMLEDLIAAAVNDGVRRGELDDTSDVCCRLGEDDGRGRRHVRERRLVAAVLFTHRPHRRAPFTEPGAQRLDQLEVAHVAGWPARKPDMGEAGVLGHGQAAHRFSTTQRGRSAAGRNLIGGLAELW